MASTPATRRCSPASSRDRSPDAWKSGEDEVFFASGGYIEIQPGYVTILADTAIRAEDIDEASAKEAEEAAERARSDAAADVDFSVVAAQIAEALAQQRTLDELRKYKR